MSKTNQNPTLELVPQNLDEPTNPQELVTIDDWMKETEQQEQTNLDVIRVGTEPKYMSFFSNQGTPTVLHYLEATPTWTQAGYYQCLGQECPGCKAHIDAKKFLLLPVIDLEDAKVKILRIPSDKGPGKLFSEVMKVLGVPDNGNQTIKVIRSPNFQYNVEIIPGDALSPDVAKAIKSFKEFIQDDVIDIASSAPRVPASEMETHERIAKRLQLEGISQGA